MTEDGDPCELTEEQKKNYLLHSNECPHCGSGNLDGGFFNVGTGQCWREAWCRNCGKRWNDIYYLAKIEGIER